MAWGPGWTPGTESWRPSAAASPRSASTSAATASPRNHRAVLGGALRRGRAGATRPPRHRPVPRRGPLAGRHGGPPSGPRRARPRRAPRAPQRRRGRPHRRGAAACDGAARDRRARHTRASTSAARFPGGSRTSSGAPTRRCSSATRRATWRTTRAPMRRPIASSPTTDLADEAARIRVPTLVVTGEGDIGSNPRMALAPPRADPRIAARDPARAPARHPDRGAGDRRAAARRLLRRPDRPAARRSVGLTLPVGLSKVPCMVHGDWEAGTNRSRSPLAALADPDNTHQLDKQGGS